MAKKRRKLKKSFKILLALVLALIVAITALIVVIVATIKNKDAIENMSSTDSTTSITSSVDTVTSDASSKDETSSKTETSSQAQSTNNSVEVGLDKKLGRLLLINGTNPLPSDYDTNVRAYLVEIDPIYRNNNNVTKIHKDVYPYITAMVAAAQADGVDLKVWSPFRDYATQNILFQNQVNRVGGDEAKAATVVARPGTSEHNTGLGADFNMADDAFENTPMFTWMCQNAENYGFILRYPKDKQHITGVIYESWHWRFVGIENAKEMNRLGVTLEEYIEMKKLDPKMDMYGDDSAQ